MKLSYKTLLNTLPGEYKGDLKLPEAAKERTIVVLDDDPTGCQTMHGVPVLFSWDTKILAAYFRKQTAMFFVLINTRSMTERDAVQTVEEVMRSLEAASEKTGRKYLVISRSDSTLRGHYPAEPDAIALFLQNDKPIHCLVPAFFQGGRYTVDDVHYVKEGDELLPASETPFAKDKVFGFKHAEMKQYVEDKTLGAVKADEVLSISIQKMRAQGPGYVRDLLLESDKSVCFVNAFSQSDLDVFAAGAWEAMLAGKSMLFRTAASVINSLGAIPPLDPLGPDVLRSKGDAGGLIIVGSYVPKTNKQLQLLLDHTSAVPIEIDVPRLLKGDSEFIRDLAEEMNAVLGCHENVIIYTSRDLIHGMDATSNLAIGSKVSDAIVEIVRELRCDPSFIISKGGITSHEVAVNGLGFRKTTVIGQALPGVPVLVPDENPNLKYIIFPGNVGGEDALLELYKKLNY